MPDTGWSAILDELEQSLSAGGGSEWTPPAGLGPLPADLVPRATALLAAQQDAILRAGVELDRIGQELSALRRPPGSGSTGTAAYIDTVA